MSNPTTTSAARSAPQAGPSFAPPALPPLWAVELLDVTGRRGRLALAISAVLATAGLVVAFAAPRLVPPRALAGALVGVTALAIGLALALALDALDVRVRGPRHVRSSGGELVALLPETATVLDVSDLAAAVRSVQTPGGTLHLGLAPVGEDLTSAVTWTRSLAEALADEGASVLLVDLAAGPTDTAGVLEVVRDRRPLGDVVTYVEGRSLAIVGPGADRLQALQALVTLPTVLPADVDVLLVALPQIITRSAVNASRVLDQVLFVAEANLTSRVELMASLDALRVAGCAPQVVLVDGGTYRALRPATPGPHRERTNAAIPAVPLAGAVGRSVTTVMPEPAPVSIPIPIPAPMPEPEHEPEPELQPQAEPGPQPRTMERHEPVPPPVPAPAPLPVIATTPDLPRMAGEPSSPLRTVDVLDAAAREQAETTLAAALVDTMPMDRSEMFAAPAPVAPAPVAPAPVAPAPVAPAPVAAPRPSGAHDDLTTELSSEASTMPAWASVEDEDDLLRTTVQLSVFHDELDLRDGD